MKKDIFDYLINLSEDEYRMDSCIDDIYNMNFPEETLKIDGINTKFNNFIIADSIKHYKNEVLYTKIQYMNGVKYYNELKRTNIQQDELESYDFLCREYWNHVIICLYSIYDKTFHILNDIYELNIDYNIEKEMYKKAIREKLKKIDKKTYRAINSIFSQLMNNKYVTIRDNNVHNKSDAFVKFEKNLNTPIKIIKEHSLQNLDITIKEICKLINKQKEIINELIKKYIEEKAN